MQIHYNPKNNQVMLNYGDKETYFLLESIHFTMAKPTTSKSKLNILAQILTDPEQGLFADRTKYPKYDKRFHFGGLCYEEHVLLTNILDYPPRFIIDGNCNHSKEVDREGYFNQLTGDNYLYI